MARTSHLVLAIQGDPNLELPFKGSQEITNRCLQGVRKAYQVLAILGNPTFKPPSRGLQEITNGSLQGVWKAYQVLAQVILRDFKLNIKIKTINGSQLFLI